MFEYYNHLGSRSYYRKTKDNTPYSSIKECLDSDCTIKRRIDESAVLSILMKNYCIGDRSLLQGVERTPWMSRYNSNKTWEQANLPIHGMKSVSALEASTHLHNHLRTELIEFIEGKSRVGVLLSGGMDSRIVAGIVRELQDSKEYTGQVVAVTWGIDDSRDVVYAKRIAGEFGWEFEHLELTPDVLQRNIELAAIQGAEYSPVHLHAMELVSNLNNIDGIIAGSYGDSIGRGEYSGRRANVLPNILDHHLNHFAFLSKSVERTALQKIRKDLEESRSRFPGRDEESYREIEMQMHYMRRQLNSCMEVIDREIPLYQAFSSPEVFGYMWSLSMDSRTDDVYDALLNKLSPILQEIPWARTGKKYNSQGARVEDDYTSLNNRYGLWLRNDLRSYVTGEILDGTLSSLGIFNDKALSYWAKNWPRTSFSKADRLDEKMAWLASLSLFCKHYKVQSNLESSKSILWDCVALNKAKLHTKLYHLALGFK